VISYNSQCNKLNVRTHHWQAALFCFVTKLNVRRLNSPIQRRYGWSAQHILCRSRVSHNVGAVSFFSRCEAASFEPNLDPDLFGTQPACSGAFGSLNPAIHEPARTEPPVRIRSKAGIQRTATAWEELCREVVGLFYLELKHPGKTRYRGGTLRRTTRRFVPRGACRSWRMQVLARPRRLALATQFLHPRQTRPL
jgi:hypothetical protein